jgi:hypothetical protein
MKKKQIKEKKRMKYSSASPTTETPNNCCVYMGDDKKTRTRHAGSVPDTQWMKERKKKRFDKQRENERRFEIVFFFFF